jgi:hypothetical protein
VLAAVLFDAEPDLVADWPGLLLIAGKGLASTRFEAAWLRATSRCCGRR